MTHNDSQAEALARCPFCGGAGDYNTVQGWHGIGCLTRNCPGYRHALHHRTKEAAIAAWNRRTALSALAAGKVEAIPEGFRLLPVEATDAMTYADWDVTMSDAHSNGGVSAAAWRAMVEAAPQVTYGNGHSGVGWYMHDTDYPEEGAVFLGPECTDATSPSPSPLTLTTRGMNVAELDPRTALAYAKRMKDYCDAFNDRNWANVMLHGSPDEQNLAHALDNLTECAAMLMNMAGRDHNEVMALVYLYGSHCAEHPEDAAGQQERLAAIKATLPHPALDRANAGERESEGARCASYECKASQRDGVICADDDCDIASGVRAAALPAADPERREGAVGVNGADGVGGPEA